MAALDYFDLIKTPWGQTAQVDETLTPSQWSAGWGFLGADPPLTTQFNLVQRLSGQQIAWLYLQLESVAQSLGVTLTKGDSTGLQQVLARYARLVSPAFTGVPTVPTAAPGTATGQAASTAFVDAAVSAAGGRLLGIDIFNGSGTFTPRPGMTFTIVEAVGGGGGGGGAPGSSTTCTCGGGGQAGSHVMARFTAAQIGASAPVTAGPGGAGGDAGSGVAYQGAPGGTTTLGALLSCPGGSGGGTATLADFIAVQAVSHAVIFGGVSGMAPAQAGFLLHASTGQNGFPGFAGSNLVLSGSGGASRFAAGGVSVGVGPSETIKNGMPAGGYGAGGSGGCVRLGLGGGRGGDGAPGRLIAYQYA